MDCDRCVAAWASQPWAESRTLLNCTLISSVWQPTVPVQIDGNNRWFPRWHRDIIYASLLVISSSCRRTVWTPVAFGHSLYSVRYYGTLCLDCCGTLATALLALVILWKHSVSQGTSSYSTFRGFGDYVLYKSTFYLLSYLLTTHHCWDNLDY